MKDKSKKHSHQKNPADKALLSQQEPIAGTSTFSLTGPPHGPLELPDGNNKGAEPTIYQDERKSRT
jgi:hypothetical protein